MITRLVSLSGVLLLGGLLAGCGAGGDGSADSAGSMPASQPQSFSANEAAADKADVQPADAKPADVAKAAAATATETRLVRTAEVVVEVKNVAAAARTVRTAAVVLGGVVSSETTSLPATSAEDDADQTSEITLRVPEPKMDDALDKIAAVGHELNRSTTSEDVTATIVDLDSRVATQTKSVARVRDLLERANSLQDVVLLESELARRESDLESIQARQRALVDKAALSTITVSLRSIGVVVEEPDEAGFMAGFDNGWDALKSSTTVVLTVLGAVLPVGVVIALIGIPAYLLRRRWHSPAAEPVSAPAAAPVSAPASPDPAPTPASTP
ncbi:MAG TPA: DUF4349 domain-containing protein [Kineosporiaceae bacterium]|nr:DUF4349 domain-containing protein [Kineosporiaceae bacterium]